MWHFIFEVFFGYCIFFSYYTCINKLVGTALSWDITWCIIIQWISILRYIYPYVHVARKGLSFHIYVLVFACAVSLGLSPRERSLAIEGDLWMGDDFTLWNYLFVLMFSAPFVIPSIKIELSVDLFSFYFQNQNAHWHSL